MIKDPPRRLLTIISMALGILFVASLYYEDRLPGRILGLDKIFCHFFLIGGAIAANWGGRLLDWIRRRN